MEDPTLKFRAKCNTCDWMGPLLDTEEEAQPSSVSRATGINNGVERHHSAPALTDSWAFRGYSPGLTISIKK
jgi:hypothetical protein